MTACTARPLSLTAARAPCAAGWCCRGPPQCWQGSSGQQWAAAGRSAVGHTTEASGPSQPSPKPWAEPSLGRLPLARLTAPTRLGTRPWLSLPAVAASYAAGPRPREARRLTLDAPTASMLTLRCPCIASSPACQPAWLPAHSQSRRAPYAGPWHQASQYLRACAAHAQPCMQGRLPVGPPRESERLTRSSSTRDWRCMALWPALGWPSRSPLPGGRDQASGASGLRQRGGPSSSRLTSSSFVQYRRKALAEPAAGAFLSQWQ